MSTLATLYALSKLLNLRMVLDREQRDYLLRYDYVLTFASQNSAVFLVVQVMQLVTIPTIITGRHLVTNNK